MRWWTEKGLKGFRLTPDADLTHLIEYDDICLASSEPYSLLVTPNGVERCPVHPALYSDSDSKLDYPVRRLHKYYDPHVWLVSSLFT